MLDNIGQSWGLLGKLKKSIKGIGLGFIVFLVAFPVLFWNEGRAVKTAKSLAEGASSVTSIEASSVSSDMEGKLVHLTGLAQPSESLQDDLFLLEEEVIQLKRVVEMYQWQEIEIRRDDSSQSNSVDYEYEMVWSTDWISSRQFQDSANHVNPSGILIPSRAEFANTVFVEAFELADSQIERIPGGEVVPLPSDFLAPLPDSAQKLIELNPEYLYVQSQSVASLARALQDPQPASQTNVERSNQEASESDTANGSGESTKDQEEVDALIEGVIEQDVEPTSGDQGSTESNSTPSDARSQQPQVGDLRIRFEVTRPQTVSIIAAQSGNSFRPYPTKAGRNLDMLRAGSHSAETMFQDAVAANQATTWIIRLVGFAMMAFGAFLILRPIAVVADAIPYVGGVLQFGVLIVSILVAAPFSILTIGIAWIFYRPLLGIALVVVGTLIIGATIFLVKSLVESKQRNESSVPIEP